MRDASGKHLGSRSAIMKARKGVKCQRHFQVRPGNGNGPIGDEVQLTCCVCGTVTQESIALMTSARRKQKRRGEKVKPASEFTIKHFLSYWKDGRDRPHKFSGGVRGTCKTCTKIVRDELYPLPKKEEGR